MISQTTGVHAINRWHSERWTGMQERHLQRMNGQEWFDRWAKEQMDRLRPNEPHTPHGTIDLLA